MLDQPLPPPPRVPVTPDYLADMGAKQAAYSEQRRRYMAVFEPKDTEDEDGLTEPRSAASSFNLAGRKRVRSKPTDGRQLSFRL